MNKQARLVLLLFVWIATTSMAAVIQPMTAGELADRGESAPHPLDRRNAARVAPANAAKVLKAAKAAVTPGYGRLGHMAIRDIVEAQLEERDAVRFAPANAGRILQAAKAAVTPGYGRLGHMARRRTSAAGQGNADFPVINERQVEDADVESESHAADVHPRATKKLSAAARRKKAAAAARRRKQAAAKAAAAKAAAASKAAAAKATSTSIQRKSAQCSRKTTSTLRATTSLPTTIKAVSQTSKTSTSTKTATLTTKTSSSSSSTAKSSSSAKTSSATARATSSTSTSSSFSSTTTSTRTVSATTTRTTTTTTTRASTAAATSSGSPTSAYVSYPSASALADLNAIMAWAGDSDNLNSTQKQETVAALLSATRRYLPELKQQDAVRYLLADIKAESDFLPAAYNGGRLDSGASLGLMQVSPASGAQELPLWMGHSRVGYNSYSWSAVNGTQGELIDYATGQQMVLSALTKEDLLRPWVNIHLGTWVQSNLARTSSCDPYSWTDISQKAAAARSAETSYAAAKLSALYTKMTSAQSAETASLVCSGLPRSILTGLGSWVAGPAVDGDSSYTGSGDDVSAPYFANIVSGLRFLYSDDSIGTDWLNALVLTAGLVDYRE